MTRFLCGSDAHVPNQSSEGAEILERPLFEWPCVWPHPKATQSGCAQVANGVGVVHVGPTDVVFSPHQKNSHQQKTITQDVRAGRFVHESE